MIHRVTCSADSISRLINLQIRYIIDQVNSKTVKRSELCDQKISISTWHLWEFSERRPLMLIRTTILRYSTTTSFPANLKTRITRPPPRKFLSSGEGLELISRIPIMNEVNYRGRPLTTLSRILRYSMKTSFWRTC
jgi:hypothetical protein